MAIRIPALLIKAFARVRDGIVTGTRLGVDLGKLAVVAGVKSLVCVTDGARLVVIRGGKASATAKVRDHPQAGVLVDGHFARDKVVVRGPGGHLRVGSEQEIQGVLLRVFFHRRYNTRDGQLGATLSASGIAYTKGTHEREVVIRTQIRMNKL